MARPPPGSAQTECAVLPYNAPPVRHIVKVQPGASGLAEMRKGRNKTSPFPGAGSLLQGNDDGMNELDFQTALHVLVHADIGETVAIIQGAGAELVM